MGFKAVVTAVFGESEYQLRRVEMKTLLTVSGIYPIETVADDRHPQSHFRSCMNA